MLPFRKSILEAVLQGSQYLAVAVFRVALLIDTRPSNT